MSIIAEPFKEGGENFPPNKIVLIDGRELDCYPLSREVRRRPSGVGQNWPVSNRWQQETRSHSTAIGRRRVAKPTLY